MASAYSRTQSLTQATLSVLSGRCCSFGFSVTSSGLCAHRHPVQDPEHDAPSRRVPASPTQGRRPGSLSPRRCPAFCPHSAAPGPALRPSFRLGSLLESAARGRVSASLSAYEAEGPCRSAMELWAPVGISCRPPETLSGKVTFHRGAPRLAEQ